ncbi:MBL fold metallo-hydrolase [Clostridium tarantellae]|uniref:MBL fold metallo-hydrolase n=1 Tax=Clostridium tarantellae TaxID=39493 RepID=A0A6I1MIN2_9CLOT|nr:MBL fold metallo-hydrolase [Clostridium tarantellae]MPQ43406.1 MBL fold metallo-hydrolase [Clostridium tarantellae]
MIFCSLFSGSSGNSIFVSSDNTKVLVDAGLSGKKIIEALQTIDENPKEIDAIFITHEHSDHIKGAGIISRKLDIPIYANEATWLAMEKSLGNIKDKNIKVLQKRSVTTIKDLDIVCFNTPHDSIAPMGYTFSSNGKSASIVTDIGTFTEEIKRNIKDSQVVLLESNHDVEMLKFGPYPYDLKRRVLSEIGHLCNEDCGRAIVDILNINDKISRNIVLGHLSNTNNVPELAYTTVLNVLNENKIAVGKGLNLRMADRYKPSSYIKF